MAGRRLIRKLTNAAGSLAVTASITAVAAIFIAPLPSAKQYLRHIAHAAPVEQEKGERPAANSVRLDQSGDRAKLTFGLTSPLEVTAFVLADPDRVIVDLPQVDFALDPEAGRSASPPAKADFVVSYRFGQIEPGKSRIVLELGHPAIVRRADCETLETNGQARLVIELAKTDRASFQNAAQEARARLAALAQAKKHPPPQPVSAKPVIVLDPGHGGIDRGARVKGLVEKELVFDFAKAVATKLEADGRFKLVMTREDDSFVPLSERVRIAREGNAALFVSIHADTLPDAGEVSGATVYTLSDRASDAEAARFAEKENQSDAAAGLDAADETGDVSGILFDLTRRETRAYSHMFARTLVNYFRVAGKVNKNPRRSAGFRVLRAPDVPSILLELGYLSNNTDTRALTSPQWREKAAGQVADAITAFFSSRENSAALFSASPDLAPVGKIPPAAQ
ncbi:MAG: N-acetylmuramoyl-L-alanine amidase [Beijerinckiaceae bacterium]|nr:N-acetylmuramoyl-L-alanine amidase [Beijerinckiaceae bacterium]